MKEITTERLILRPFAESDYDDLYEFLSQLRDDEFEGYPGITYENGKQHLAYRLGSEEFYAAELANAGKVIGNIYCGREVSARRKSAISSTGSTGGTGTPKKPSPRSSGTRSGKARTGCMRNATRGTRLHGSCSKKSE